jgi:hypothetical protein
MLDPDVKLAIRDIAMAASRAQQLAEWQALTRSHVERPSANARAAANRIAPHPGDQHESRAGGYMIEWDEEGECV